MIKKNLNKILIIIVLIIWGIIIYNYTQKYFKNTSSIVTYDVIDSNNKTMTFKHKNFKISVLERDPFLDIKNKITIKHEIKKNKNFKNRKVINVEWPVIEYFGFVKNDTKKLVKLVILNINNNVINIKEKSFYNNSLYIQKAYKDSVVIRKQKEKKTFKKLK